MKEFLVVATGGAGGDLQPLVAAALAVGERGHRISFIGDRTVGRALSQLSVEVQVLPPELDLGPRFEIRVKHILGKLNFKSRSQVVGWFDRQAPPTRRKEPSE